MKHKYFWGIRFLFLFLAFVFSVFLFLFFQGQKQVSENRMLFVLDVSESMNARDVVDSEKGKVDSEKWIVNSEKGIVNNSDKEKISRLDAAKLLIKKIIETDKKKSYGLVVFSESFMYVLPPTHDTGTFVEYLDGLTTNILPGGGTNWDTLAYIFSGIIEPYQDLVIFSDMSQDVQTIGSFPNNTVRNLSLVGIGSEAGAIVRYANGNIKKYKGQSVYSTFTPFVFQSLAQQLGAKKMRLENMSTLDTISNELLESGFFMYEVQGDRLVYVFVILLVLCVLIVL